jgi:hypothetical protein
MKKSLPQEVIASTEDFAKTIPHLYPHIPEATSSSNNPKAINFSRIGTFRFTWKNDQFTFNNVNLAPPTVQLATNYAR